MEGTYSLAANLNVLRSSQASEDAIAKILLLSLMHGDFVSCCTLLTGSLQSLPNVNGVLSIAAAYDSSDFKLFWELTNSSKKNLPDSFVPTMQARIAHLLSNTFNRIKVTALCTYLNMNEAELKAYVSKSGWSLVTGDQVVQLPKSVVPTKSPVNRTQELISLASLAPVLRTLTIGF
jgi:hypothetical protein